MIGNDHMPAKSDIIELGHNIPTITENMLTWLEHNPLPEGFLFENYQISIGVTTALRKRGIKFPDRVKAIGIDEIPDYILSGANQCGTGDGHEQNHRELIAVRFLAAIGGLYLPDLYEKKSQRR